MDDRHLIGTAVFHMAVNGIIARIYFGVGEPFVQIIALVEQRLTGRFLPIDGFGLL